MQIFSPLLRRPFPLRSDVISSKAPLHRSTSSCYRPSVRLSLFPQFFLKLDALIELPFVKGDRSGEGRRGILRGFVEEEGLWPDTSGLWFQAFSLEKRRKDKKLRLMRFELL